MYARGQYVRIFDGEVVKIARPTMPDLSFLKKGPPVDDPGPRENAQRFAEHRIVRQGLDALQSITESGSFENYCRIGRALLVGRNFALRTSGANAPHGSRYAVIFSRWIREHKFEAMAKSLRSVCIDLAEHAEAITAWRDTLPERQRKRLVHPLSVTRRWRASTAHNGKCPQDWKREAVASWRKFCACVTALPADEARPLWESIAAEAAIEIAPQNLSNKKALREGAACGP